MSKCMFKELLVSVIFPPVHTGREVIVSQWNSTVRNGGQNPNSVQKCILKFSQS